MTEDPQAIGETIIIPDIRDEDRKKIIREIKKTEKKEIKNKNSKKCIVCGKKAEYYVKGMPNNTYCRECAKENFKYLNYLEKMS